jgi:hypothetical protein
MVHFFERDVRKNCETCGETYLDSRIIEFLCLKKFLNEIIQRFLFF